MPLMSIIKYSNLRRRWTSNHHSCPVGMIAFSPKSSVDSLSDLTYRSVSFVKALNHSTTRKHILNAALKRFARCGYAAASVQQIVTDAGVSKPALYYYFPDKAALFQALVDQA